MPKDRKFVGFDAYKKAMDCLKPGDIAIFATPLAFRWVHFTYAIEKGLNVFMEKPVTVDGPTRPRMLKLAEEATAKNLKVGVGLMSRHSRALQELAKRIQDGEIGDIILHARLPDARARSGPSPPCPSRPAVSELLYQIQRFHSFLWASGGCFSDFYIHIIDHLLLDEERLAGQGPGAGRPPLSPEPRRRHRTSTRTSTPTRSNTRSPTAPSSSWTGAAWPAATTSTPAIAHGTKGMAIVSKTGDCGLPSSTYKGQTPNASEHALGVQDQPGPSRIPIRTNGTTWSTPSATTSPTTRRNAASKPAS